MKFRLNKILLLFLLVFGIMTLTGCSTELEGPMEKAEAFLNQYYTVQESELANFFYEEVALPYDPKMEAMESFEEYGKMVEEKYSPWMTERGYQDALANRFIPGVEMFVKRTYNKMAAQSVTLSGEQDYQDGRMYYSYAVDVQIQLEDGETENIPVAGELVMEKVQEEWKVDVFIPKAEGLQELMTYGVSNLRITNWDVEDKIGYVEVSWEGGSGGAINADETAMGLGETFSFRMPSEKYLLFNVKLFDTEDRALVEYGFETNFSSGRNFQLYIMWDETRENVVLSESYDSAIIGGAEGPTEIVVVEEEGEFQRSVKMTLQKVVDGQVERTVEIADSCSEDMVTEVVMDHMLRSAAWEGIDVRELDEYYILMDHLFEEGETKENYIYIDQGEIFYQAGLDGRRSNITQESYEKVKSFFKY
ncbi:hypothetical protein [Gudongella sp. DL1XJH-153]|uniref:hypothetical protein n=1 Tax=Gudongella sp. DL1XJH-153 TaxID=3409804 RepID=UPI003BB60AE1